MVHRILWISLSLLISYGAAYAQTTGTLQGKVVDGSNEEGLAFANVVLMQEGTFIKGVATDFDGNYNFSNLNVGTYDIEVSYVGYSKLNMINVRVGAGDVIRKDLHLTDSLMGPTATVESDPFVLPVIPTSDRITGEEAMRSPVSDVEDIVASTIAGANAQDAGEALSTNASRTDANVTMVDGERSYGSIALNPSDIEEIQIITNSVPVEFGDGSGSFTNYITKSPSNKFRGYVAGETSQFLDPFGRNVVQAAFSGPILMKPVLDYKGDVVMDGDKPKKYTVFGYRLSGEFNTTKDSRPSALGSYQLTESKRAEIMENPLILSPTGEGSVLATDFITQDDL
ncbi:MAG: TonB-dependent receptor, partial [Saprospiraceae bacterium]|nr:TonB-dependent receptor [Saprospiraceae bacterium]